MTKVNDLFVLFSLIDLIVNFRFQYFGVQFYAECWGGEDAGKTFARDGLATEVNSCWNGVGRATFNAVYRLEEMPGTLS